jgi:hypothetical protein
MQFKVPQDVQRADQILWFITLRQLILILIGGGISYGLFTVFSKKYVLGTFEVILLCIPAAIAISFAFVKIKGIPLFKFILLLVETSVFRAPRRYWQTNSNILVSMTTGFRMKKKSTKEVIITKNISEDRIKNLANLIDHKSN